MAEPTRAMVVGALLRPLAIVAGGTFAVHRLGGRLDGASGDGYPAAIADAFRPDPAVRDAIESSATLAGWTALAGLAAGLLVAAFLRSRIGRAVDGAGAVLLLAVVLAVAVPGIGWLVVDTAGASWLAGDGGTGPRPLGASVVGPWLASVALVPAVVGFVDRERSGRARWPHWPAGVPATLFTIALAATELLGTTGGVFDRFGDDVAAGRADDLLELTMPVVLVAAGLALAAELTGPMLHRRRPAAVTEAPDERSAIRRVTTSAVLAAVATGVVVALGLAIAPSGTVEVSGPRLGGPWLGTDGDGRSLAPLAARALAVNLAGAAIPALGATVVGAGLAVFLRVLSPLRRSFATAALDLLSWPAVLVVPLAAATVASTGRPVLDPVVIQFTGLLLVPGATRLLLPPAVQRIDRLARLVATFVAMTWLALGVHLLVGWLVADRASGDPGLGALLARGIAEADRSPWPAAAPTLAALLAAVALLWALAAVTATVRLTPVPASTGLGPADPADGRRGRILEDDESPASAIETPVAPGVHLLDDDRPLAGSEPSPRIELLGTDPTVDALPEADADDRGADGSDDDEVDDGREGDDPAPPGDDRAAERAADGRRPEPTDDEPPPGPTVDEPPPADDTPIDDRPTERDDRPIADGGPADHDAHPDVSVPSAVDAPAPPVDDRDLDEDEGVIDLADEATHTIELRPSDLRRAGVRPPNEETP